MTISFMLIGGAVVLISTIALSKKVERLDWDVELELDAPYLTPQVVRCAILRSNPIPEFAERLKKLHKKLNPKGKEVGV